MEGSPPKLLDRVRAEIRARHYSSRTADAYVMWIRRFIVFHGKRHPSEMREVEVRAFLTSLATERDVRASTQNQALSAILSLYAQVLHAPLPRIEEVPRARVPGKLPTVLSREEVARVIGAMDGVARIVATLLYGSGLRLLECLELRVKDLDFERPQILLRRGKGKKAGVTMLPAVAREPLQAHLSRVRAQHEAIWRTGWGESSCPLQPSRRFGEVESAGVPAACEPGGSSTVRRGTWARGYVRPPRRTIPVREARCVTAQIPAPPFWRGGATIEPPQRLMASDVPGAERGWL